MLRAKCIVNLGFQIIRRSSSTQNQAPGIFFFLGLNLRNSLGALACTYNQEPCGKRVQCTCKTNFLFTKRTSYFFYNIKRSPAKGLIEKKNLSVVQKVEL